MTAQEVIATIRAEIERLKSNMDDRDPLAPNQKAGYLFALADVLSLLDTLKEPNIVSPFTGGKVTLESREEEITFRGEKIKIDRKFYRCKDTGKEFTDAKLDDDMMWDVFRKYCEKKGFESFEEILPRDKQQEPEVDLVEAYQEFCKDHPFPWSSQYVNREYIDELCLSVARHYYELGKRSGSSEIPKDARIAAEQFYPQDCFDSQAVRELGIDCFVDGAKWHADHAPLPEDTLMFNYGVAEGKRLMMEEAVEADVISNAYPTTIQFRTFDNRFHHGDKVHIIVIPNTDEK